MRVAVMGAGAVGCYYGGMLARAGHDVVLIGRPAHVDAVAADGLRLQTATFEDVVPVGASTDPAAAAGADVVLVSVKSSASERAAADLRPHLGADTLVLSLQNGLDNASRMAAELGRTVLPAVVYVATEMAAPGHVRHHGRGELVVDDGPDGRRVRDLFAPAGIPVDLVDDVRVALWAKLVANCAWNALSAITDRPYGWLAQVDGMVDVLTDTVAECRAVAAADAVQLPHTLFDDVVSLASSMPAQRSSTAQDLARHRPTEIDHLNGYVVRRGTELGVPTPVNRLLTVLVGALEQRDRDPDGARRARGDAGHQPPAVEACLGAGFAWVGQGDEAAPARTAAGRVVAWANASTTRPHGAHRRPAAARRVRVVRVRGSSSASGSSAATSVSATATQSGGAGGCPPAGGTSSRTTSFSAPPPMCIDAAKTYTATMKTDAGSMTIALDAKAAPKTVNNFVVLARNHFYDGVTFHRVIQGFMAQGGDPEGTGMGGPGYQFEDELPKAGAYKLGSVAMANSGPDTNGSQFFIVAGPSGTRLPPQYSLFGQVTSGMDTLEKIMADGSSGDGAPAKVHTVESVTITEK